MERLCSVGIVALLAVGMPSVTIVEPAKAQAQPQALQVKVGDRVEIHGSSNPSKGKVTEIGSGTFQGFVPSEGRRRRFVRTGPLGQSQRGRRGDTSSCLGQATRLPVTFSGRSLRRNRRRRGTVSRMRRLRGRYVQGW